MSTLDKAYEKAMASFSKAGGEYDKHAAHELELYIDNDSRLHQQQVQPILKNLATKKAKGAYDTEKAVKLWMYLMEAGAKKYVAEMASGTPWNIMFNKNTRSVVARRFNDHFETEYDLGNYDHLLPKKYQKK